MHPPEVRARVGELIAAGWNDCQAALALGLPRTTVRDMRRGPSHRTGRSGGVPGAVCPRCWRTAKPIAFSAEDYAELLGLYLGDGCLSAGTRTTRLRLALDAKYGGIIADAKRLLERAFPENRVGVVRTSSLTWVNLSVYSVHLPCLLPQHGPGKKHQRRICLEPWQSRLVEQAPWAFLRGCIRSDGCVFVNRTGPYEYLTYGFNNRSRDIVELFVCTCELVGVRYRLTGNGDRWQVRINRRESVGRLLAQVGIKE